LRFSLVAHDGAFAAIAFALWLAKTLGTLGLGNHTRLEHAPIEPSEQILVRLFGVFSLNTYHIGTV